jgi:hypothetical protein
MIAMAAYRMSVRRELLLVWGVADVEGGYRDRLARASGWLARARSETLALWRLARAPRVETVPRRAYRTGISWRQRAKSDGNSQ